MGCFEIERLADGVFGGVQHQVAVLQRGTRPLVVRSRRAAGRVGEMFVVVVELKSDRVVVCDAVLDLLA